MFEVYSCRPSYDDSRPTIDFDLPVNAQNDWLAIGKVVDGTLSREDWPSNVDVTVEDPTATMWDGYIVPGAGGLYSLRFVEVIGSGLADFSLLPATLNRQPYVFLLSERRIACFDRRAAVYETHAPDSPRILSITHFAFDERIPVAPVLFCIPETLRLLATKAMADRIGRSDLKGIRLEPLP